VTGGAGKVRAQLGQGSVTLVFEEKEYRRRGDESGIGSGFETPNMVGHFLRGGPGNQENITIGEEAVFLQDKACLDFRDGAGHGGSDPLPPEMLKTLNPWGHDQIVNGVLENLEKNP
jgi:hypothetical protein